MKSFILATVTDSKELKDKFKNKDKKEVQKGKSGIHINPKNKGKFTATKKATGKSTEELTHSKNTLTKKRAVFAQNAKKWKHENGGKVENTFGKDQPFPKLTKKENKGGKLSKDYIKKAHDKPGGSNVGKEKFANGKKRTGPYVGPSGGSPKGSYPIPDVKHAKAAIKLSGHAPNPEGIKKAVYKKFPQLKKHEKGGAVNNSTTADSTKYYQKQVADNIANHFKASYSEKAETAKKVTQSKEALKRQENKGKPGYDKNGFPIITASKQKGGEIKSTKDSTNYYNSEMLGAMNMADRSKGELKEHFTKKWKEAANNSVRQKNKGKEGFDKNGFPIKSKQKGGEIESIGDQAAAYKKGNKVKQMGGQIYGAAKKGTKIDVSKWKKSK